MALDHISLKMWTDNTDTFRTMITDLFVPTVCGIDVKDVWFQQDSAICTYLVPELNYCVNLLMAS